MATECILLTAGLPEGLSAWLVGQPAAIVIWVTLDLLAEAKQEGFGDGPQRVKWLDKMTSISL